MFDTHCHLNFSRFKKNYHQVIEDAQTAGITHFVVPGTDFASSKRAVEIAQEYEHVYAAVGIHPHHAKEGSGAGQDDLLAQIEHLLTQPKVVAVGEVGLDRHIYEDTKYADYNVDDEFISRQKELFITQIKLAITYKKSLIVHNREAKGELLTILHETWSIHLEGRTVIHCCEPDQELLDFVKSRGIFLGVDGDVTYDKNKQNFIAGVPLEYLVLETDSPFLLPEPLKSQRKYPNEPKNISLIAQKVAELKNVSLEDVVTETTHNAHKLFGL